MNRKRSEIAWNAAEVLRPGFAGGILSLSRLLSFPLNTSYHELTHRIGKLIRAEKQRKKDRKFPSYALEKKIPGRLLSRFEQQALGFLKSQADLINELADLYLEHRFDLLGSDWKQVFHNMDCRGVDGIKYSSKLRLIPDKQGKWLEQIINTANLDESLRIWRLLGDEYGPIDWQLDFKSGYRWSESTWHKDIEFGNIPAADIKVPWELSRMQHLSVLARAHLLGNPDTSHRSIYSEEFRNEIIDFIATNPPRFGVNWASTMDVAIRAANWIIAYDLFKAAGVAFDDDFTEVFKRSIWEHGAHIVDNLEYSYLFRGNHYLANIAGLLFVAVYLPASPETETWSAFCIRELISEVERQFLPDGGNFEASTSYHRLSGEMAVYSTALILGLSEQRLSGLVRVQDNPIKNAPTFDAHPIELHGTGFGNKLHPFSESYISRLKHLEDFTEEMMRPDGMTPQIGDSDNGRFIKIDPSCKTASGVESRTAGAEYPATGSDTRTSLAEMIHDHRHLLSALAGLINLSDSRGAVTSGPDCRIIEILAKIEGPQDKARPLEIDRSLRHRPIRSRSFPDFGIVIFRSKQIYLAVRCGPLGQEGRGGHAHNDQLSLELVMDGIPLIIDPGTYCYTPSMDMRNLFRSTGMHNTLCVPGQEQNKWEKGFSGLFRLSDQSHGRVIHLSDDKFVGEHVGFGGACRRTLRVFDSRISCCDEYVASIEKKVFFHFSPELGRVDNVGDGLLVTSRQHFFRFNCPIGTWHLKDGLVSPAYGSLTQGVVACLTCNAQKIEWTISSSIR